jgi:hypothetical protein
LAVSGKVGSLQIWGCPELTDIRALANVTEIDVDFMLGHLSAFSSLDGVQNIRRIGWDLQLVALPKLTDLSSFSALREVGSVNVDSGTPVDLSALKLDTLGELALEGDVATLAGRVPPGTPRLEKLLVLDSPIADLRGLESIQTIGSIQIESTALRTLAGLEQLHSVISDFNLHAPNLQNVDALSSLATIGGMFRLDATQLESLHGLTALTQVGGTFALEHNSKLQSVDGAAALQSVQSLQIEDNPALTSLRGFSSLTQATGYTVQQNPQLPQCEANWLARRVAAMELPSGNGPPGMCAP